MIEIIKYIVLGIIQGITEIFPVSSSGHLVFYSHLFNIDLTHLQAFLIITNFGSFLALLLFFRKEVIDLFKQFFGYIFSKEKRQDEEVKKGFHYTWKLVIAVIPVGIAGLFLDEYLPKTLLTVSIGLLITGTILFIMYILRNKEFKDEVSYKNAIIISFFHIFSLFPGISRSGITTSAGVSQKINIKKALTFSFLAYLLISIPVTLKGAVDLYKFKDEINVLGYSLAFLFSFAATFFTARLLFKWVTLDNLIYFSIYCIVTAIFALTYHFVFLKHVVGL